MKKWKIIRFITITFLIIFFLYLISDVINCINMSYPHPMLGIDAHNWIEQFTVDITFIMIIWGVPLIIDVVLIIISINKIKNGKNPK